jgi:hypothetical protein
VRVVPVRVRAEVSAVERAGLPELDGSSSEQLPLHGADLATVVVVDGVLGLSHGSNIHSNVATR